MESVCNECAQEMECREPVVMRARILRVNCCDLLVCDLCGCQEAQSSWNLLSPCCEEGGGTPQATRL